jgi:hypothetical protein
MPVSAAMSVNAVPSIAKSAAAIALSRVSRRNDQVQKLSLAFATPKLISMRSKSSKPRYDVRMVWPDLDRAVTELHKFGRQR